MYQLLSIRSISLSFVYPLYIFS